MNMLYILIACIVGSYRPEQQSFKSQIKTLIDCIRAAIRICQLITDTQKVVGQTVQP